MSDREVLMAVILAALADEEGFNSETLYEVLMVSGKVELWEEASAIAESEDDDETEDDPEVDDILRELDDSAA